MTITEIIKQRKSIRSFTGESLSAGHINKLRVYISELSVPFGAKSRIELVSKTTGEEPVKLGTYGVIKGATDFFILINGSDQISELGGGYIFERLVLYCTELGLGTCWLGGTFNRKDFKGVAALESNENIPIISPVGYPREKRTLLEKMMRAGAGSDKRKPFETIFYKDSFEKPLTEKDAGEYYTPLEMVRLGPSASNVQPWRIIMQDGMFHFYHRPGHFSVNDLGIALCHFELICKELGLNGKYSKVENTPTQREVEYIMSWIVE